MFNHMFLFTHNKWQTLRSLPLPHSKLEFTLHPRIRLFLRLQNALVRLLTQVFILALTHNHKWWWMLSIKKLNKQWKNKALRAEVVSPLPVLFSSISCMWILLGVIRMGTGWTIAVSWRTDKRTGGETGRFMRAGRETSFTEGNKLAVHNTSFSVSFIWPCLHLSADSIWYITAVACVSNTNKVKPWLFGCFSHMVCYKLIQEYLDWWWPIFTIFYCHYFKKIQRFYI